VLGRDVTAIGLVACCVLWVVIAARAETRD
jgi:hypothetical protein